MDGVISPWKDVDRHEPHARLVAPAPAAAARVGATWIGSAAPGDPEFGRSGVGWVGSGGIGDLEFDWPGSGGIG